jgi:hypothetical protein
VGFWLCTSARWVTEEIGGPGRTDPCLGLGVLFEKRRIVCRAEYQEGDSGTSLLCACSTFAIGVCGECGKPVCGKHSAISGDLRLCNAHLAAEQDKIEQARKDEQARNEMLRDQAWSDWEDLIVREMTHAHPVERIIRFLRLADIDRLKRLLPAAEPRSPGLGKKLRELLPDIWSGDLKNGWDDDDVHAWLIATRTPEVTNCLHPYKRPLIARVIWPGPSEPRRAQTTGWTANLAPPQPGNTSISALTDGRRGFIDPYGVMSFPDPPPAFNVYAMWHLGDAAQLGDLPGPPERDSRYADWRLWGDSGEL